MKKLIIVGGGGFAKEIIWLAEDCGFSVVGILDDSQAMAGLHVSNIEVLGSVCDWVKYQDCSFVLAIGSPRLRRDVLNKMKVDGDPTFATLIHPDVKTSKFVNFGEGSMICAGCILTVDIEVGAHCILNLNVTIGHETAISNFVTVAPMAAISGCVILEECVEVGTGAVVRQGLAIERGAMLGMGGVLTKNIPQNTIFAGNPAKKLKALPEI